jgi:quercetin dioxygenase-like cupin family protein
MNYSRRELSFLLPALAGVAAGRAAGENILPSATFPFESLPVKTNEKTHSESRDVFSGTTHSGYHVDMHITTLPAGQMPHPPHHHVHEEAVFVQQGTLEVTILGKSTRIGPGSVAYVKSNEEHGWQNVGAGPATYFVLALGHDA